VQAQPLLARPAAVLAGAAAAQSGQRLVWAPVWMGGGIGLWFALPWEPAAPHYAALGLAALAALALAALARGALSALALGAALLALGAGLAAARSHAVAGPVLEFRYYGPVEGRVVGIDRSGSDKPRLTLDRVVLARVAPERVPRRVRVSLHSDTELFVPRPGQRVMLTGHLSPPPGPAEPGGFDFQRHAWFLKIGAVGYTRTPLMLLEPPQGGLSLALFSARMALSEAVQARLPGRAGGFAAAVTTGDRSAIAQEDYESLRRANLAHLLAISGLHMGLLTGFVFAALRIGLALIPAAAQRVPARKIAALGALLAGAGYLALAGGNVATERAFVMVDVALGAVLLDRRAFTLRAVAIAALIVLVRRPEALMSPGFQMSFAATVALVAGFEGLRRADWAGLPRRLRPVGATVVSSVLAGAATAPFAAAHFNILPHYGLIANLVAVPAMGLVVMPAAVLAALLAPLGLEGIPLRAMGLGIEWILAVAETVSGLPGAVGHVKRPDALVLPLVALAGLVAAAGRGWPRAASLVPAALAAALWAGSPRPALLVSESGGLVGLMTEEGRALSKPRGDGFAASMWLENDGGPVAQDAAAARAGLAGTRQRREIGIGGQRILHVTGRDTAAAAAGCGPGDWVISSVPIEAPPPGCRVFDPPALRATGALAVMEGASGVRLVTARDLAGRRLWNDAESRRAAGIGGV
jgi:competence protein ComEC